MEEKEEAEESGEDRIKDVAERYNIDLRKLEREQLKLAKNLEIRDSIDFNLADRVAGIDNVFFKNRIISAIVVLSGREVVEQEYFEDKLKFPYISGLRAYRELSTMVSAFNKLDEKPDLIFVRGQGILHPRNLGLASHFSIATGIPSIGIADSLLVGMVVGEDIFLNGELFGKVLATKKGARPIYISPGNMISVETAVKITKKFIIEPHKIPEPLRLAKRYAKEIRNEIFKI